MTEQRNNLISKKIRGFLVLLAFAVISWSGGWLLWGVFNYMDDRHDILYINIDGQGIVQESGVVGSERNYSGYCPKTLYFGSGKSYPLYICHYDESGSAVMFKIPKGFLESVMSPFHSIQLEYKSLESKRSYLRKGFEVGMRLPGLVAILASIAFLISTLIRRPSRGIQS